MLINKNTYGYSRKKRYITGRGFLDAMSSVFNSFKSSIVPTFKNVASYVSTNRDLIAKPLLGAIGSLAAKGAPALINYIAKRNGNRKTETSMPSIPDDPKYKEILQSMISEPIPVSNVLGSGVKRRGAGIKTF